MIKAIQHVHVLWIDILRGFLFQMFNIVSKSLSLGFFEGSIAIAPLA